MPRYNLVHSGLGFSGSSVSGARAWATSQIVVYDLVLFVAYIHRKSGPLFRPPHQFQPPQIYLSFRALILDWSWSVGKGDQ